MKEPKQVLAAGTRVVTHEHLESTEGMFVSAAHLLSRKPNATGVVKGCAAGHGGDVYWVNHEDGSIVAVYSWSEFELCGPLPAAEEAELKQHDFRAITSGPYALTGSACCTKCGLIVHGQTDRPCVKAR